MGSANLLAILSIVFSFFVTLLLTKLWIRAAKRFGLTGKDMNKINGKDIAEAGGIAVLFGTLAGIFTYVFFKTFFLRTETHVMLMFAVISSFLLAAFLGFIDDILGWKRGLRWWQKPLLTLPAALPLMVLNAGHATMDLPIIGKISVSILYPLMFVPIGVVGAANGFNILAGMNGLEAGMGIIILSALGFGAFYTGFPWLSLVAFCAVAALFAFFLFNRCPAKVFPGDSLTYGIGALIAIIAILGDLEKLALILFIPYFIEIILKARHNGKIESFGMPQPNGTLKVEKIGSLTHVFVKLFKTERATVRGLFGLELLLAVIATLIYL